MLQANQARARNIRARIAADVEAGRPPHPSLLAQLAHAVEPFARGGARDRMRMLRPARGLKAQAQSQAQAQAQEQQQSTAAEGGKKSAYAAEGSDAAAGAMTL